MHRATAGRFFLPAFLLICAVFAADQYSKWFVMEALLRPEGVMPVAFSDWFLTKRDLTYFLTDRPAFGTIAVNAWLNIVMVWNKGVSFGLFDSHDPRMALVFVAVSGAVALGMTIWLALARTGMLAFALALLIGGALGNVADRLRFAAVVDFIDAYAGGFHWPAFNVADACIVAGAFFLALDAVLGDKKRSGGHW